MDKRRGLEECIPRVEEYMALVVQYCFTVYKRALLSGIIIAILNAWHLL